MQHTECTFNHKNNCPKEFDLKGSNIMFWAEVSSINGSSLAIFIKVVLPGPYLEKGMSVGVCVCQIYCLIFCWQINQIFIFCWQFCTIFMSHSGEIHSPLVYLSFSSTFLTLEKAFDCIYSQSNRLGFQSLLEGYAPKTLFFL